MVGPLGYVLWVAGFLVEAYVVLRALVRREFFRYFTLNLYMMGSAVEQLAHYFTYYRYGFTSPQYIYVYYYSDSLMTILMFFAIMELYQHVFSEMHVSKYIRAGAILLLSGTALFTYMLVHEQRAHLTSKFVVELGQNLYFVGMVLTYLLWGALLKLRETRARLIQLVLALGIYFSAAAALYAFRNLFPNMGFVKLLLPLVGTFLPFSWAYTFTRIPEEARLATAQVALPHR